ncbi:hypothetical protein TNCV_2823681 [Trichonephila clavipes]|nr:hypothetical protein TNCV_2823681 [Trichonephila clavipes]
MARSNVYEWYCRFKEGRESIEYDECVERPLTSRYARKCCARISDAYGSSYYPQRAQFESI